MLTTTATVYACGLMPAGQVSSRPFTATGFTTLPLQMVYSSTPNTRFPGIATNEARAVEFVHRFAMQTIFVPQFLDVLVRQDRNALLPDPVVSAIWDQVNVSTSYVTLHYKMSDGLEAITSNIIMANWPKMV
ncbi:hypothetical protein KIN20_032988 [Parelaphostrongylus tenuis]|uniref:Uncharacterized protein n=1 Tax=Parelaphostrongylus tenuis TaxID=148309 RepID=A0AAD5WI25_PARTN|nr:hypothetical protein KIN20_032988 [Parelaphostrongylus tenuis]